MESTRKKTEAPRIVLNMPTPKTASPSHNTHGGAELSTGFTRLVLTANLPHAKQNLKHVPRRGDSPAC